MAPVMYCRTGKERMSRLDSLGRDSTFRWLCPGKIQRSRLQIFGGGGDDRKKIKYCLPIPEGLGILNKPDIVHSDAN